MHLKLFLIALMFFMLTSADRTEEEKPVRNILPAQQQKMYIIPVRENNAYNKAQGEILKYKILIQQERDTVRAILDKK